MRHADQFGSHSLTARFTESSLVLRPPFCSGSSFSRPLLPHTRRSGARTPPPPCARAQTFSRPLGVCHYRSPKTTPQGKTRSAPMAWTCAHRSGPQDEPIPLIGMGIGYVSPTIWGIASPLPYRESRLPYHIGYRGRSSTKHRNGVHGSRDHEAPKATRNGGGGDRWSLKRSLATSWDITQAKKMGQVNSMNIN